MKKERIALITASEKHKLPQIIVGYLKLQQAKKNDFFDLFLQKKINGRLFYNTCLPDGTKEVKYGNEDFLYEDFKNAVDQLLAPFQNLSIEQIKSEQVKATDISSQMRSVIDAFIESIETSNEWKMFWESEIKLQSEESHKNELYNMIAGAAAYKALVSCIDQSAKISDPIVKRNIAALVSICTNKYESPACCNRTGFEIKRSERDTMNDFTVFKKSKPASGDKSETVKRTGKRKHKKKKPALEPANVLMK
ncbi:MAG TPA: hypothetical protein VL360_00135 [Gammaproteobacteria bacterium]|jgi:hypothetical protein|nr:hypothetical protein [Gammaproteobacteria bacterium]